MGRATVNYGLAIVLRWVCREDDSHRQFHLRADATAPKRMKSAPCGQSRLDQTVARAATSGDPLCPFAQAEQLVAVAQHVETQRARGPVLQLLDLVALELHDVAAALADQVVRSEEHTSELQSPCNIVCRLLLAT